MLCAPGPMGAALLAGMTLPHREVGSLRDPGATSGADTRRLAAELAGAPVCLLLFAGGDGTAVDVLHAVGDRVPVLGIPAGVKMHSPVFAVNPARAGVLAASFARAERRALADAEVLDLDEEELRAGRIAPRLHGTVRVPVAPTELQRGKARTPASDAAAHRALAASIAATTPPGQLLFLGPGTTMRAVAEALGVAKSVLGVDAVRDRSLVAGDADEAALISLARRERPLVLVTPIGGQGFLLGRGNQQLSAAVLRLAGPDSLRIVCTERKLAALAGAPLRIDTGDPALDAALAGYRRVATGPGSEAVYPVVA